MCISIYLGKFCYSDTLKAYNYHLSVHVCVYVFICKSSQLTIFLCVVRVLQRNQTSRMYLEKEKKRVIFVNWLM